MIVWTIANQKGGVGKTTTCVSLAGWMKKSDMKVLLIDTDPHASLTNYFGYDSDELPHTLFNLFTEQKFDEGFLRELIMKTDYEGIDIMPGSLALSTLDRTLGNEDGIGNILRKALETLSGDYDAVLIDCPPVLGVLMVNAIGAASRVIVPCQTEFLALKGLERMMKTFDVMTASTGRQFSYLIVPTMYDRRTRASVQSLESIRKDYSASLWGNYIPIDTKFRDSSQQHVPLPLLDPESRGSLAYHDLFVSMMKLEGIEL